MSLNLMQQMEMLEDMVLNGASVTSVISIGWNGVGSGSSDDSGGSGSQDDGGLSDEELHQVNAEVMAQLFENINALIALNNESDEDLIARVFETVFSTVFNSGTGGSGSAGTDGGTSGGTDGGWIKKNPFAPLKTVDPNSGWRLPEGSRGANVSILPPINSEGFPSNLHKVTYNGIEYYLSYEHFRGSSYWTLSEIGGAKQWKLLHGDNGADYWVPYTPPRLEMPTGPGRKISFTVTDATETYTVDFVSGSSDDDVLSGSGWINGDDGNDAITGSAKDDVLKGGRGNDWLAGLGGDDVVNGGTGNDIAGGQDGDDKVSGGTGDDQVWGGLGDDHLTGDSGHDWLAGEAGNDTVEGGDGDDIVGGQEGADNVLGGNGNDELWGGAGADRFFFTTALNAAGNVDQIKDFSAAEGDKILLKHEIFSGLPMGFVSSYLFTVGAAATTADQRIVYDQNTDALSYDADGSGSQAAVQFAKLSAGTYLTAYQFTVV
jgi:Ca2+-binding RTX toxin-like protein